MEEQRKKKRKCFKRIADIMKIYMNWYENQFWGMTVIYLSKYMHIHAYFLKKL